MINYVLEGFLCGMIVLGELIGIILLTMFVQLILYRVFKFNLYKNFIKGLKKLESYVDEVF